MTLTLHPTAPYSFDLFLAIHSRFPQPSLFRLDGSAFYQTLRLDNAIALVRITSSGIVDKPALHIEPIVGNAETVAAKIAYTMGLNANINDFYAYAHTNEVLWRVIEPLVGLPIDRSESVFQALIFVIIEQHISWINAQKSQRALVEWANNVIVYEGQAHYAMPSPAQLAAATVDDLKPLKITFKRMELLIHIAQQIVLGNLDLEALLHESPQTMYNELLKIKGIGHWTASVVIGRVMGVFPYVPHNDVGLQAAVREYFGVEKSAAATDATFAQFGDYAGLAAHFTLMRWVLDRYPVQVKG
jgi:DNA-3-methyladenine glycosylase II